MKETFEQLLHIVRQKDATDVHMTLQQHKLRVELRGLKGLEKIEHSAFEEGLFHYLKYIAHLDLGNASKPQSGNFQYDFNKERLYFRFSLLPTLDKQTAVLRILNNHEDISLDKLSYDSRQTAIFHNWTRIRSGLIVLSGPTGSGKTTTLHAILRQIALENRLRVVSLEDPIEIFDDSYLQLQINEQSDFTYEEGIRQLMRHDPDVIMIGEIRDPTTARMLLRSALSGHLIFTTIHARNCQEALKRLMEFGLNKEDLHHTLSALCAQRLYVRKGKKERICIYEILENEELEYLFQHGETSPTHEDIIAQIQKAVAMGLVDETQAGVDVPAIHG